MDEITRRFRRYTAYHFGPPVLLAQTSYAPRQNEFYQFLDAPPTINKQTMLEQKRVFNDIAFTTNIRTLIGGYPR